MMTSRILLAVLLAEMARADDVRTLPAVRRPGEHWMHRGAITVGGPPCPRGRDDERLHAQEPDDSAHVRCLVLRRVNSGDRDVHTVARTWTDLAPASFDAWIVRAVALRDVEAAREAVWLRPEDADAWNLVGSLCSNGGCGRDSARQAFLAAVRLRPTFGEAWTNLALSYSSYDDDQQTLHAAREAVRLAPDAPLAWMALGHAALPGSSIPQPTPEQMRERHREAALAYERWVRLAPDSAPAWSVLAGALTQANDPDLSAEVRFRLRRVNVARARRLP